MLVPASQLKLGIGLLDAADSWAVADANDTQHLAVGVQLLQWAGLRCHVCLQACKPLTSNQRAELVNGMACRWLSVFVILGFAFGVWSLRMLAFYLPPGHIHQMSRLTRGIDQASP